MFVLTTKSHTFITKMMQMTCKFTTFLPFSSYASLLSFTPSNHTFSSSSINHTFPYFYVSTKRGRSCKLSWDDVLHISKSKHVIEEDPLQGYFHKVQLCNRGSDKQSKFLPFVIEGQVVGCIHHRFVEHLRDFNDVLVFTNDGGSIGECVSLHPLLKTAEERTSVVGNVIKHLGEYIPAIRNEAYGIHMSGYVELDGEKHLWIGMRSPSKSTYPGMLDPLVAGGQENVVKECEEEAGIPRSISIKAKPVGAISYIDIDGYRYNRDIVFCYDLILPESFVPKNEDGEVESFKLIPVKQVAEVIRKTQFFKPNCAIGVIDFLFRHGYISPENHGYLDLLRSLVKGDCS